MSKVISELRGFVLLHSVIGSKFSRHFFKVITRIGLKIYYKLKAFLKRCVLGLVLKESKVSQYFINSGRLFQSLGRKGSVAIGGGSRSWDRQIDGP